MNHEIKKQQGFTIVELMLAMTFVAVLLLAIALLMLQIGSTYVKGTTIKEVNQAGRAISEDVRRTVAASGKVDLATDLIIVSNGSTEVSGRLCLGTSTYIWNTAAGLDRGVNNNDDRHHSYRTLYANETDVNAVNKPHFVKIVDREKKYCAKNAEGQLALRNILTEDRAAARELLQEGDRALMLHKFLPKTDPAAVSAATGQKLYKINFVIGTSDTRSVATDPTNGIVCKPPSQIGIDVNYCMVQEFNLIVRAAAGV